MLLDAVPMGRLPSIVSDSASWSARSHPIRPAIERSRSAALWATGAGRLSQICLEVRLGTWSGHCATACDATHAAAFATGRLSVLSVLSVHMVIWTTHVSRTRQARVWPGTGQ